MLISTSAYAFYMYVPVFIKIVRQTVPVPRGAHIWPCHTLSSLFLVGCVKLCTWTTGNVQHYIQGSTVFLGCTELIRRASVFVCMRVDITLVGKQACTKTNGPLTSEWTSSLWWVIIHDLLHQRGIHLLLVRMDAMMNAAAHCYLDSPEVTAMTNCPHTHTHTQIESGGSSQGWALFTRHTSVTSSPAALMGKRTQTHSDTNVEPQPLDEIKIISKFSVKTAQPSLVARCKKYLEETMRRISSQKTKTVFPLTWEHFLKNIIVEVQHPKDSILKHKAWWLNCYCSWHSSDD